MTREQAEKFIGIYNALMEISTKGKDTKTMADVLRTMEELANTIEVKEEPVSSLVPDAEPIAEGE